MDLQDFLPRGEEKALGSVTPFMDLKRIPREAGTTPNV